ncbi:MAG: cytochrome C biogenesis protein [Candidatus Bipolaricaulota bacterium]|nr:cytochrome C biogenesis protein [Candidatus Bipolaricaulota bacterium]
METVLSALSQAIGGSVPLALGAAFAWGVLSILLSPCHLASIPLIVGYIGREGSMSTRRALALSVTFAVGILITIAAVGGVTAAAGRMIGDVGRIGNYVVAAVFFFVGLYLLDVIPLSWAVPSGTRVRLGGLPGALVLGLLFGVALGPCTFAYMAPMLAVAFDLGTSNVALAVVLLLAFGLGHCSVIAIAGTSMGAVQKYLHWNEKSRAITWVKRICGVLVICGSGYLIYTAL